DLDGDGDLDLFIAAADFVGGGVYFNDGSGGFTQVQRLDGTTPIRTELADFNGDGHLDVLLAPSRRWVDELWLNDGQGTLALSETPLYPTGSNAIAMGDVNGDGLLDYITGSTRAAGFRVWKSLSVPVDDGLEIHLESDQTAAFAGDAVNFVATLANTSDRDLAGVDFRGLWTGALADAELLQVDLSGSASSQLVVGPITSAWSDRVDLPAGSAITYRFAARSPGIASLDTAMDAQLGLTVAVAQEQNLPLVDVVDSLRQSATITIIPASDAGSGFFASQQNSLGPQAGATLLVGDVNGDGRTDIVALRPTTDGTIYLQLEDGGFAQGIAISTGSAIATTVQGALADLDGDGDLDLVVAPDRGPHQIWLNDGGGGFVSSQLLSVASRAMSINAGDLDGDGDLDLYIGTEHYHEVWINDGAAHFINSGQRASGRLSTGSIAERSALGDLDGDGDLDVAVAVDGILRVQVNDGRGGFAVSQGEWGVGGDGFALGDVDGDHDLDIVAPRMILLNDGSGEFTTLDAPFDGKRAGVLALADVDGDGD
ncbi:MAG: VCBS repeat-containing protein, partial [Planctomycetales bacterium]|nr:VCBS repeat-containing protein [Planctomycetales bacterium]